MKRKISLLSLLVMTAVLTGCNESQNEENKTVSVEETIEIIEETTGYPSLSEPLADIPREDIKSVSIERHPSNIRGVLNDEQTDELWEIMSGYTVYQKDNSYGEYDGGGNILYITKTDGTEFTVMEFGNFLVIDQNGYQADMNSAELVQAFAEKHFPD